MFANVKLACCIIMKILLKIKNVYSMFHLDRPTLMRLEHTYITGNATQRLSGTV
jgi:hypothetical protein